MRTIVTLCDRSWQGWGLRVRTQALDLYPLEEDVEFWDATGQDDGQHDIWGHWPRSFTLGGPALMAEFDQEITRLGPTDELGLVFVIGDPVAFAEPPSGSGSDRRPGPPDRADLLALWGRRLADPRDISLRVPRVAAFNSVATPATCAAAAKLIDDGVFDSGFFLHDWQGGTPTERERRFFLHLRLLAEIVCHGTDGGTGDQSRTWLRAQPRGPVPVFRIQAPFAVANGDPSSRRAAEIVGYFARQSERGQDQAGAALSAVDTIAAQIRQAIDETRTRFPDLSPDMRRTQDLRSGTDAIPPAADLLPEQPQRPQNWEVSQQARQISDRLAGYYRGQRDFIRAQQTRMDEPRRRARAEIIDAATTVIHAHETGLTNNAIKTIDELLNELRRFEAELATAATKPRDLIFTRVQEDGSSASSNGDAMARIRSLTSFKMLQQCYEAFFDTTTNFVRLRHYAAGALGGFLAIYILLAHHTYTLTANPSLIGALLLDPDWSLPDIAGILLLSLTGVLFAGLALWWHQWSYGQWKRQRSALWAQADRIVRQLAEVVRDSEKYDNITAEASWYALIRHRLAMLREDIVAPRAEEALRLLRPIARRTTLTEDEQQQFETEVSPKLAQVSVDHWVKVMLDRESSAPVGRVELTFANFLQGSLHVTSRLADGNAVQIGHVPP